MSEELRYRITIDTEPAKAKLREMDGALAGAAGSVGSSLSGMMRRGLQFAGLGAAFGAGQAALTGATQGSIGSMVSEALGGFGSELADMAFGTKNEEAKASQYARGRVNEAFNYEIGRTGRVPQGAVDFYRAVRDIATVRERGTELIEQDPRLRAVQVVAETTEKVTEVFQSMADRFADGIVRSMAR